MSKVAIEHAILIAHNIALGLGAAQSCGIVHYEVKPQHILLSSENSIKLADLGMASVNKRVDDEFVTGELLAATRLDLHASGGNSGSGRSHCFLHLTSCEAPQAPSSHKEPC